jgi:hypothetical protein
MPRDPVKRKASNQRYLQSDKGKAAHQAYEQSDKGKAAKQAYAQSDKGKAAHQAIKQRYNQAVLQPKFLKQYPNARFHFKSGRPARNVQGRVAQQGAHRVGAGEGAAVIHWSFLQDGTMPRAQDGERQGLGRSAYRHRSAQQVISPGRHERRGRSGL